jgi:hypothetical protein
MNKEILVGNIKEWVRIDNEMKTLQKELKDRRLRKKELTESLVETMRDNEIDEFNMQEGKLVYAQNKVKAPLSKKHLLTSLHNYFKDETGIAEEISKFIMETRDIQLKETIRRKQPKK